ncbi:MAG: hydratase [Acidobacteriia bacterium]|nr:hydratase [Terriglobia bacterium]
MTSASKLLAQARISHKRLPELPAAVRPKTPGEAYVVQDGLIDQLLAHYGGSVVGYKVACTNVTAQRQLNVDAPFCGRLLSAFFFESPARVDASKFFMRVVEAEFAFEMARDLPPISTPRSRDEIATAVKGVLPGIEIVDSRFDDWTTIGAPSLIADNACNAAWVKGRPGTDWQSLWQTSDLATQAVRLTVNGKVAREGTGRNVLGHPLNALEWLVNSLSARGLGLKAGQFVTTGVTTEVYMAERGDRIMADFGPVGSVDLDFV